MSTPDQPSQPLTRRRLRELKMTGQTPVITPEDIARAAVQPEPEAPVDETAPAAEAPETAETPEAEPADADKPFALPETSVEYPVLAAQADEPVDRPETAKAEEAAAFDRAAQESTAPGTGGRPLTRREIREQERLRTAQIQVVLPPVEGVPAIPVQGPEERPAEDATPEPEGEEVPQEAQLAAIETVVVGENETSVVYEVVEVPFADEPRGDSEGAQDEEPVAADEVHELVYEEEADEQDRAEDPDGGDVEAAEPAHRADEEFADRAVETVFVVEDAPTGEARAAEEEQQGAAPTFGQRLFAPEPREDQPESFEQILTHAADSSGSSTAGSTLILASDPSTIPLSAPITATGELIVTSSHTLPEGFGSRGHAQGAQDGKEVDVVLLDGELPLASSPMPLSASDAVSTSKSPSEVIRPPAPEKTHRLTLLLGITAGVLGIALIGVVVAAFTTGVLG